MKSLIPIAYAIGPTGGPNTVEEIFARYITYIINPLIYLFLIMSFVVFLWGLVEFISGADNPEKASKGKKHILWGLIGLVIIVAVFGIINFICRTITAC